MAAKKKTTKKPVKKSTTKAAKTKSKKAAKKPVKAKALKTYIFFMLDKSASMETIRAETIEHFNEQVEQIQKDSDEGMENRVSLITFNHTVSFEFFDNPMSKLKPLTLKTYKPHGSTSMYDGVGLTIDKAEKEIKDIEDKDVAVLCIIVSDGQENSSKIYKREDIAERIQRLQETERWTFVYLGANQDLSKVTEELNLYKGNVQAFVSDSDGMKQATVMSVSATSRYISTRSQGGTQSKNFYDSNK